MEKISTIVNGKDRILAMWAGDTTNEAYAITKAAASEVEATSLRISRIINNDRLSAEAKRDDRKSAGLESLQAMAKFASRIEGLRALHSERANRLAAVTPYRDGDAATPLIDMEIARKISSMTNATDRAVMLVTGEQPRLTEAVLRLPAFLSGLSDAEHRRIASAAIERANPKESRLIAQEGEDLDITARAVHKAFKLVVEQTGAELVAQVAATGEYANQLVNAPADAIKSIQRKADAA